MFMGCLPKISIFWFPANPLAKSRDAGASDISSNSGNHFVWTCVGHYEVYYEVPNRERGSGKYLLGLLEGLSCCSNTFPSLRGNEQKMLKDRLDTFLSP